MSSSDHNLYFSNPFSVSPKVGVPLAFHLLTLGRYVGKGPEKETVAPSEEAQPTLGPWTGFEPVRLETPRTPEHAWFHCATAAPFSLSCQPSMDLSPVFRTKSEEAQSAKSYFGLFDESYEASNEASTATSVELGSDKM
ncbi:hypothetical protein E2C01_041108 [Portunus trituberculatus]|uniref:Uncharacterized protein n=1 Tax=Portunus trituberculatus TaxID=210409 RepID=A0A5B7FSM8_PORTR|nr:hypothetical protein [Portunus trituberculatus]